MTNPNPIAVEAVDLVKIYGTGENAVNALYGELDGASRRYSAALELADDGETARARAEMKSALDELQAIAVRCSGVPGCDGARFYSTYDRLLRAGLEAPVDAEGEAPAVAIELV